MQGSEFTRWQRWCEQRDQRAFAKMVEQHVAYAYDFARRVTGHDADAEDIAQQALLELTQTTPEVPERVGLRAFLGRRIVLAARTLRRSALTRLRLEKRAARSSHTNPMATLEARDQAEAALRLLDEPERDAVVLRYLHGLSYAEIAHILGVQEAAARMRVHRALRHLRQRLGPRSQTTLAGLALFVPPADFLRSTVKVASLTGKVVIVGITARQTVFLMLLIALLVGGGYGIHVATRDRADRTKRAARPAAERVDVAVPPETLSDREARGDKTSESPSGQPPAGKEGTPKTTVLNGQLRYVDGTPLRGARVQLDGAFFEGGDAGTTTDMEGRFSIEGAEGGGRILFLKTTSGHLQLRTVVVRTGEINEIDVVLERGVVLEGTVVSGDAAQRGVSVFVSRTGGHETSEQGLYAHGSTDEQGRFRFDHVLAGTYEVMFRHSGHEPTLRRVDVRGEGVPMRVELRLAEQMAVRLIDVPLALTGVTALLAIRSGRPGMPNRAIAALLNEGQVVSFDRPEPGRCQLRLLLPNALGEPIVRRDLEVGPSTPAEIEMRLPAGGRVQGAIVGPDGSGLAGHGLILEPGLYKITTANDGRYVLGYVKAGTYRVFVRSGSGRVPAGTIKVDPGATRERVIRLSGTGSVLGRVAPAPVRGKGRATFRRSGEVAGDAVVDVHGAFRLEYLEPGEYELTVDIDQTRVEKSRVVVRAGEVTDAGVISSGAPPPIPIAVRVPTGTTIPRQVVITIALAGRTIRQDVLLDGTGRGMLSRVPAGKHSGRIETKGFRAVEIELLVPSTAPLELGLELEQTLEVDR